MFVKQGIITTVVSATLIFFLLGFITDRDFFRYPLIMNGRGLEKEKAEVSATIKMYNNIFNDFHNSGGVPSLLNDFPATKAIRHDVFRDIGYIRDAGRIQIYDMADMVPVDVNITSFMTAEAVVLEQWNYIYQQRDDRKPISSPKGIGRGFRYYLVRERGHWMVSAWNPEHVEEPIIEEFRH